VDYNQHIFKYLEPLTTQTSIATNWPTNNYPLLLDQMVGVGYTKWHIANTLVKVIIYQQRIVQT
jgi:hypothetical protein